MARRFMLAGLLLIGILVGVGSAADAAPSAKATGPAAAPKAAASSTDPVAHYKKTLAQFKQTLADIRALQGKYQLAPPAERPTIADKFDKLVEQAKKLVPELQTATIEAYRADPKNVEVAEFLVTLLADAVDSDRIDEAQQMLDILRAGGYSGKGLAGLAGVVAFRSDDFEQAKVELEKAAKAGGMSKPAEEYLKHVDEYIELWKAEQSVRAAEAKADDLPRVKFQTTKGDIVIELFENEAPIATANFINLVEKHFYDGLTFHRVLPGFMAQGGDPKGTGSGGPGYTIRCECYEPNHRSHFAGTLSMAHAGRDTGGSQFFLTFGPTPNLNGKHTAFGRVIEGLDIARSLQKIDPDKPNPSIKPDEIIKATVIRKRDHAYEPPKGPNR